MEVWIPLLGFGYNSDTDKTLLCHNWKFGKRLVSSALTIYKLEFLKKILFQPNIPIVFSNLVCHSIIKIKFILIINAS